jgi:ABC-type multidrug transport system fused ATPase/permease subunit
VSGWLGMRPGDGWTAAPGGAPRGTLAESDEDTAKIFQWDNIRRLFAYLLPHKGHALLGVAAMVVLQGVNLAQPLLEGAAIDRVVTGDLTGLLTMVGIYLATLLIGWAAQYHQVYQMTWAGQHVLYQVASDMFNHIIRLSLTFFDRNETGRIMSRVQSDVTLLQQILSSGLIGTLGNLVSMIGIIATMFVVNWRLALLATAVIPLFVVGMLIWQNYARRSFRRARAAISEVSASLQENVSGVRVIQSLGREDENYEAFEKANRANLHANIVATQVGSITQPMVEIMSGLGLALVIFFGGQMVIEQTLTIGLLYAFSRYVVRFFEPIRQLTQEYNQLQRAAIAAERIFEVLDTEQDVKESEHAVDLPTIEGRVTYDHVDFGYLPDVEVLHDFTLDIAPGERVAFVGQTGAGKSTLISLLMRFYDVTGGRIMIDGHDIRDLTFDSLRRQIGIVLQEPVLFAGSIADNIRYARPDASDAEVEAAAKAVGADEVIQRLERGYATPIHERGVGLSIGERQLIAFARALFADPRILVLDEATANLDTRTEQIVQRGIHQLTGGRTALIIAHRLSTIRDADRIVVMEQGRIVEQGDHAALLAQGGLYHRLYSLGFQSPSPVTNGHSETATLLS